ncbi:arsenite-resistance protein [Pseudoscourfieldia marina]
MSRSPVRSRSRSPVRTGGGQALAPSVRRSPPPAEARMGMGMGMGTGMGHGPPPPRGDRFDGTDRPPPPYRGGAPAPRGGPGPYQGDARGGYGGGYARDDRGRDNYRGGAPPGADRFHEGPPRRGGGPPPMGRHFGGPRDGGRMDAPGGGPPGPPGERGGSKFMTFNQFVAQLPDGVEPKEAERRYEEYRAANRTEEFEHHFEKEKNDDAVRRRHDPRKIDELIPRRDEAARKAAVAFGDAIQGLAADAVGQAEHLLADSKGADGDAPAAAVDKNDNDDDTNKPPAQPASPAKTRVQYAHASAWAPSNARKHLEIAMKLAAKLDAERGITSPPVLPEAPSAADRAEQAPTTNEGGDGDGETAPASAGAEEGDAGNNDDGATAGGDGDGDGDGAADDMDEDTDGRAKPANAETNTLTSEAAIASVDKPLMHVLDIWLSYLWRVHGVDFYKKDELAPCDFDNRTTRTRVIRPNLRMDASFVAKSTVARKWHESLTAHWDSRCTDDAADPVVWMLAKDEVEKAVDIFVKSCVIHRDNKYGCTLSTKFFMAPEFVEKHVRGKHSHVVNEQREMVLDRMYRRNYIAAKEKEYMAKAAREVPRRHSGGDPFGSPPWANADFNHRAPPHMMGGRGGGGRGGRGGRGRGRGGGGFGFGSPPMIGGGRPNFSAPPGAVPVAAPPTYVDLDAAGTERQKLDYGDI